MSFWLPARGLAVTVGRGFQGNRSCLTTIGSRRRANVSSKDDQATFTPYGKRGRHRSGGHCCFLIVSVVLRFSVYSRN
jgi:hypothetical protein